MNFLKARSARPDRLEEEVLEGLPDGDASRPDLGLERERSAQVVRALLDEALDETEKTVFTLHYGDDVPLKVITRLLGLTNRSGAKAHIVSARRKLSRAVRQWKAREQGLDE
jgi:DNA-directed RNA polymerase specialized sigma24 family protein